LILVDTNMFYSIFFETEFSRRARKVIEGLSNLVKSFTVINELIFVSVRKLAENRHNIRNYLEFRKFITEKDISLLKGMWS